MSNKKTGNGFEQELCKILSNCGYWAHNFANRSNGQPMDIIAIKNDAPIIIDCKVCDKGFFETSRIEENQELAIRKWFQCGNTCAMFAFKMPDGTIRAKHLYGEASLNMFLEQKRLNANDLKKLPALRVLGGNKLDWHYDWEG